MPVVDPWPGESLSYYDAADGDDYSLYGDVYFRDRPGRTLTDGASWRFWYEAFTATADRYLTDPTAAVEVSWVLEVNSGSGTIVAGEALDPDYGNYLLGASTPLGEFTVTGPATLVIPSALIGADQVVNYVDGAWMVLLECTSGSIDVQQVKLRVWPVGGPVGGWVEQVGFDSAPVQPGITGAQVSRELVTTAPDTPEEAWVATMLAVAGGASSGGAGPHDVDPRPEYFSVESDGPVSWRAARPETPPFISITASISTTEAQAFAAPHGIIAVLTGPDPATANPISPALVEGVDWVRPPNEVAFDDAALAQPLGTPEVKWSDAVATLVLEASSEPLVAGPSIYSQSPAVDPVYDGLIHADVIEAPATAIQFTDTIIAGRALTTETRWIVVSVSHSMACDAAADGPVPWPHLAPFAGEQVFPFPYAVHFGAGTPFGGFTPTTAHLAMPAYRVWMPTPPPARTVLRHGTRNDGRMSTAPRRWGQESSYQSGRVGGYQ